MEINKFLLDSFLKELCEEANTALKNPIQDEREKDFNYLIQKMYLNIKHSELYFSRDVYLHWNCKEEDIKNDIMKNPEKFIIEVSDDIQEHPGLVIHFRK